MLACELALLPIALLGHLSLWVSIYNRLHATSIPRRIVESLSMPLYLATGGMPLLLGGWYFLAILQGWYCVSLVANLVVYVLVAFDYVTVLQVESSFRYDPTVSGPLVLGALALLAYIFWCCIRGSETVIYWTIRRAARRRAERHLDSQTTYINLARNPASIANTTDTPTTTEKTTDAMTEPESFAGDRITSMLAHLPGNQIFHLAIEEKTLPISRLPQSLDGFSIAHLSDLHFTGQLTKPFFETIVQHTNAMEPDLIVITGDIVDKQPCFDWIPDTLGRLESRLGTYFVLGNHDLRVHSNQLRHALTDAGLIDVGGRRLIVETENAPIFIAGNELPWFGPAPDMRSKVAPKVIAWNGPKTEKMGKKQPETSPAQMFRLLLAHTPDQIAWAREFDFDLMLAGHTHGGQIRLPWIGPIISPSRFGIRYAGGTFHEAPTVMHVSRGISGTRPLRWNCPPELSKLVLRVGAKKRQANRRQSARSVDTT